MPDTIKAAAAELRRELEDKVTAMKAEPLMADVLRLHQALNTLEALTGEAPTSLVDILGLQGQAARVRPDEFFGLQPLDAAKRYLKRCGEARPLQEIIEAIQTGGARVDSEDDLRLSLSRSTWDIAKVGPDLYGLLEFYPHIRRGKKGKGATNGTRKASETPESADEEDKAASE